MSLQGSERRFAIANERLLSPGLPPAQETINCSIILESLVLQDLAMRHARIGNSRRVGEAQEDFGRAAGRQRGDVLPAAVILPVPLTLDGGGYAGAVLSSPRERGGRNYG
jgi:hypothetical protein